MFDFTDREATILYPREWKTRWSESGHGSPSAEKTALWRSWQNAAPGCFLDEDWSHIANQVNHLPECAATLFLGRRGFSVLIEKYSFASKHPVKLARFRELVPEPIFELCDSMNRGAKPATQPPDLFVYGDAGWFFVEVKGQRDRRRHDQEQLIAKLAAEGAEILLFRTRPGDVDEVTIQDVGAVAATTLGLSV